MHLSLSVLVVTTVREELTLFLKIKIRAAINSPISLRKILQFLTARTEAMRLNFQPEANQQTNELQATSIIS